MEKKSLLIALVILEIVAIFALMGILQYTKTSSSELDSSLSSVKFGAQQETSCTEDADCVSLTEECGTGKCDTDFGTCYLLYNSTTDVCRESEGECDVAEYCVWDASCPIDVFEEDGTACSEGECQNGVCSDYCEDSDNGENYYTKGNVSGYEEGNYGESIDECVTNAPENYLVLNEGYCEDDKAHIKQYNCPNGCANGSCMQEVYLVGDDNSPNEDFVLLSDLNSWISEGYSDNNPSIIITMRNNSQVTKNILDNKITIFIYNKHVQTIVGQSSPVVDYILNYNIQAYILHAKLEDNEIVLCNTILSTEVENDDLKESTCKRVGFNGDTINISLEQDFISNFTLERTSFGKIRFVDEVDISRFKNNLDLLNYVEINYKKISVDTGNLTELADKKANLTFYNIEMHNPQILYNGELCSSSICTSKSYNSNTDTFKVQVSSFSEFEIEEGPYCGDNVCQEDRGEDCGDCDDCECRSGYECVDRECEKEDDGGNNGGDDDDDNNDCTPNWNCTWSPCIDSKQTKTCVDLKRCGTAYPRDHGKIKICSIPGCQDNDGDGYGIGTDCLGPDLNDSDSRITDTNLSASGNDKATSKMGDFFKDNSVYMVIALIVLIVIVAIIIAVILILNNMRKPRLGETMAKSRKRTDKEKDDRFT